MNDSDMSFEEALGLSEELLSDLEESGSNPNLQERLKTMLSSQATSRGFFVTFLTGDCGLADEPPNYLIEALSQSADAGELLCKNLVMSTAMKITHTRTGDFANAEGSEQVARRAALLIARMPSAKMRQKLSEMRSSVKTGAGLYADFLKRWNYDAEQLQAINSALEKSINQSCG